MTRVLLLTSILILTSCAAPKHYCAATSPEERQHIRERLGIEQVIHCEDV